jgi:hypothetical protein
MYVDEKTITIGTGPDMDITRYRIQYCTSDITSDITKHRVTDIGYKISGHISETDGQISETEIVANIRVNPVYIEDCQRQQNQQTIVAGIFLFM